MLGLVEWLPPTQVVASSADGARLVAAVYGGNLWRTCDAGATWLEDSTVGSTKHWSSGPSNPHPTLDTILSQFS